MFENLNFGKTGFKTCVLEKHFISYLCILFLIFNALRSVFKNQVLFFQKCCFPDFRLIQSVFRSIEISFKILCELLSISINRNWFLINRNSWIKFFKNSVLTCSNIFFKTFFSLSDSARLHRDFLVIFLQISCKVSLSLSQYVYITLPFALFFSFSCIISWFLGKFSNYA